MSLHAEKLVRLNRVRCACGRRALNRRPNGLGVARRDDHDLCPSCWRRWVDRLRRVQPRVLRPAVASAWPVS